MQKLIIKCLQRFTPLQDQSVLDDLLGDFSEGSREYCMNALKIVSSDGKVDFDKFLGWLRSEDNFLLFPIRKFRVLLWACDLFQEFDVNGDGWIEKEEFEMAMPRLRSEICADEIGETNNAIQRIVSYTFEDYDISPKDNLVSTKELVTKIIATGWEQVYQALFQDAEDFLGDLDAL